MKIWENFENVSYSVTKYLSRLQRVSLGEKPFVFLSLGKVINSYSRVFAAKSKAMSPVLLRMQPVVIAKVIIVNNYQLIRREKKFS